MSSGNGLVKLPNEERPARGVRAVRGMLVGALGLALLGPGCKGCGCSGLFRKQAQPSERVFSDVEVLSDGSLPRVSLHVVRWTGFRYRVSLTTRGGSALEGQPVVPGPTVAMTLDHEVIRGSADPIVVKADGGVTRMVEERVVLSNVSVQDERVPPPMLAAWNAALSPLVGTSLLQRVSESAAVPVMRSELLGGVEPPAEVAKAFDRALESQRHFPFRLPEGPVGVGARWRYQEPVSLSGASAVQAAEMRLLSLDGEAAVIGIVVRQEAPRQEVPHPFVPGQHAVLEQLRGDGTGEVTLDRATGVPRRSRLEGVLRFTLSGEVQGQHGSLTVVTTTSFAASGAPLDETIETDASGRTGP